MKKPLGLKLIIIFYMFIGGLTLSLSFIHLVIINDNILRFFFIHNCFDIITENTILTRGYLESLSQNTMLIVTFIMTFLTSIFYTMLAEALYKGNKNAYIIGALLHSFAAVSSLSLWVLGVNTIKVLGIFFLVLNVLKFVYLYSDITLTKGIRFAERA
jgi:hypothetical protein